ATRGTPDAACGLIRATPEPVHAKRSGRDAGAAADQCARCASACPSRTGDSACSPGASVAAPGGSSTITVEPQLKRAISAKRAAPGPTGDPAGRTRASDGAPGGSSTITVEP